MHIFKQSKRIIKSTVVSSAALALTLTPAAAFAHGIGQGDNGGSDSSHNTAATQQAQRNDWFNRNKNRQKLTCSQRQDALNKQADAVKAKDSQKLKGFAIILTGIQQTYSGGGITVNNYDAMNAQVTVDQTNAANAVNAITAPQLNCDDPTTAAAVSDDNKTFKDRDDSMNSSIGAAQKALNTYRTDLNKLFEAVISS